MKKIKINKRNIKQIGVISVDSGCVWIGDPGYILHTELPDSLGKNWIEFCDLSEQSPEFYHDTGLPGLGICSPTYMGDGIYPVYGIYEPGSDRPKQIIIDFSGDI